MLRSFVAVCDKCFAASIIPQKQAEAIADAHHAGRNEELSVGACGILRTAAADLGSIPCTGQVQLIGVIALGTIV